MSLLLSLGLALAAGHPDVEPIQCTACPAWSAPVPPRRLHGQTWLVGTGSLSVVLVATPEGLVLIDGGLPQSAPQVAANVEALGFRMDQVRYLLNTHEHFDHAGGLAALQRLSGAPVLATPEGAVALRRGQARDDDPQAAYGDRAAFPPVHDIREMADGESFTLGGITFTMHATPGHAPGGSSWHWRSCEGGDCRDIVFADSLSAVAGPGFRYRDDPDRVARFRVTLARVAALPCDVLVTAHADQHPGPGNGGCAAYAAAAEQRLSTRLADEAAGTAR